MFLTWADVFGTSFDRSALSDRVAGADLEYLIRGLSMISTILFASGEDQRVLQRNLIGELFEGEPLARALARFDSGQADAILHAGGLVQAAHLALRHAGQTTALDSSIFGELLLGANEYLGDFPASTIDEAAGLFLHGSVLQDDEQLRYLMPRYYDLLVDRPVASGTDIASLFERASGGLSLGDFLANSLAVYAAFYRYRSAADFSDRSFGIALEALGRLADSPVAFERYRELVTIDLEELVAAAKRGSDGPSSFDEFVALHAKPLVEMSGRKTVPLWLPWVAAKIADGARWIIATGLRGRKDEIADFDGRFGKMFEDYAFDVLRRCHPAGAGPAQLYAPIRYETERGNEESNNATLVLGDTAVFLEMTITSPLFKHLWAGDTAAFRDFVHDRFVAGSTMKMAKLSRRIEDFRAGRLELPGTDASTIRTICPVIVTLLPWPRHHVIEVAVAPVWAELDPIGGPETLPGRVMPPVFVSAEELEMIEGSIQAGDFTLPVLLDDWQSSGFRASPLKNYLLLGRPGYVERENAHLLARFIEVAETLKDGATTLFRFRDEPESHD